MTSTTIIKSGVFSKPLTGRHVLAAMVSFFGVVITVNLIFAYFAVDTWTGLTTQNTYRKGLDYNQTLADAERQAALGWKSAVTLEDGHIAIRLSYADGTPLIGARVNATVRRPTHEGWDRTVPFQPGIDGVYRAAAGDGGASGLGASGLGAGQWDVDVSVALGDDGYRMIHRIQVAP